MQPGPDLLIINEIEGWTKKVVRDCSSVPHAYAQPYRPKLAQSSEGERRKKPSFSAPSHIVFSFYLLRGRYTLQKQKPKKFQKERLNALGVHRNEAEINKLCNHDS